MKNEVDMNSLKLLADPHKLKKYKHISVQYDGFRQSLESKFNYDIDNNLYSHLLGIIQVELRIDAVIKDIINQAILSHSP